jgi:hypothetical protein
MNAPPLVPKSQFTPGYQGHQQGIKYVIGQSCPSGIPTRPNLNAAHTIKPVDSFAPVHQRARSEQPLTERKTSRRRSPTPKLRQVVPGDLDATERSYYFPQMLGGSYVPPAYIRPSVQLAPGAAVTSPRSLLPAGREPVHPAIVVRADGRGTGYDHVRPRLDHL